MADGAFPGLVSKDRNVNATTNPIYVQLTDGTAVWTSVPINDNAGSITVDGSVSITGSVTVTATQLDIDDLVKGIGVGEDNVLIFANTAKDGTGTDYVPLVDGDGHLQVDVLTLPAISFNNEYADDSAFAIATDVVSGTGFLADETTPDSVDEGDIGLARMTLDRKILTRVVGASDANRLDVDSSGHAQVDIAAVSVTAVPVSRTSAANSETNPIFVQTVSTSVSGEEIHDYDTSSAVASDAADNHDYTVAGTTFFLKSVIVSASGNVKFEIQTGPVASLVTKAVGFLNGRQGDTQQVFFDPAIEVPVTSTGTVRVIRTNRQGSAQDVYSTIIGYDV